MVEFKRLLHTVDILKVQGDLTGDCPSLCYDSRTCGAGSLFVAIPGLKADGHGYIADALRRGARGVVHEASYTPPPGITALQVADSRRTLGILARNFFEDPSQKLTLLAVTGTNGKTTVAYLLEAILKAAGHEAGVLGTINYRYRDKIFPAPNTTPESYELQRMLREMADASVTHVVAEVSSHAVDLRRVDDCAFDLGVFTNLTQDHLDYHGTMEHYYAAKRRFFTEVLPAGGKIHPQPFIINTDDPWGRRLASEVKLPVLSFGLEDNAAVTASEATLTLAGIEARIRSDANDFMIRSPLIGRFNLANILAAAATALSLGIPQTAIAAGIAALRHVPGRLEKASGPKEPTVFVDYAHTDDALRRVLQNLNAFKQGRIITVFGCGGDRDRGKRPLMGQAVVEGSDLTIITSDNPRSEDPAAIIREIEAGIAGRGITRLNPEYLATNLDAPMPDQARSAESRAPDAQAPTAHFGSKPNSNRNYTVITDRAEAIAAAIGAANEEDIVLIAGKGHEDYQILSDHRIFFDDRLVARKALNDRQRSVAPEGNWEAPGLSDGPELTIAALLSATGGALLKGRAESSICGISTDSRTLKRGNLFIPLTGEQFDGHDYLATALERGAGGLLIARTAQHRLPAETGRTAVIAVEDTLVALGDIAHAWRQRFSIPVIAITGSSGKTTTKEMACAILMQHKRVLKTEGNFNNLIGLPLTLLKLNARDEIAVIEMGTNRPGEIARLTRIAAPAIGLITNIGPAHLEGLKSLAIIREEKGDLFGQMDPEGVAILNADDEAFAALARRRQGRLVTFGFDPSCDVFADRMEKAGYAGMRFTLHILGEHREVVLCAPGRHNIANALAAAAVAWTAGMDLDAIASGLAQFRPIAGRMEISALGNGAHIIDDAYNANPASVTEALKTLRELKGGNAGIAILGDMLELGDQSAALHEKIGRLLIDTGVATVLLKGRFARDTAAAALARGMSREQIFFFETPEEALAILTERLGKGDWVLVKGSRRMHLETVVQAIREHYS